MSESGEAVPQEIAPGEEAPEEQDVDMTGEGEEMEAEEEGAEPGEALTAEESTKQPQVEIIAHDATEEIQSQIPEIVLGAYISNPGDLTGVAKAIKADLAAEMTGEGETWNLVMGKTFGLGVSFAPKSYIYVRVFEESDKFKSGKKTIFCAVMFKSAERKKPASS